MSSDFDPDDEELPPPPNTGREPIPLARKPARCPACGHAPVAVIQFGLPVDVDALLREEAAGRVINMGCCVMPGLGDWMCSACGQSYIRKPKAKAALKR